MKKFRFIPFVSTSPMDDIRLGVMLIPLWWALGFRFFAFHLVAAIAFLKVLSWRKGETKFLIPCAFFAISGFMIVYLFSVLINVKNIPWSRIIGSLNNLSFWIIGGLIILVIHNSADRMDLKRFLKVFPIIGIVYSFFVIAAFSVGILAKKMIATESLLSRLLPDRWLEIFASKAMLLHSSLELIFVGEDKIFSLSFPRSPGFNVYSSALGLTMIVIIVLTFAYFRHRKNKGWYIIVFLEISAIVLSLSRTAFFGFILACIFIFSLLYYKKPLFRKAILIGLILMIVVLYFLPFHQIYDTLYNFRKGSSVWRIRLYHLTLNQAMEKPILGHGFKPRPEDFPVPIGSHSTYIGVIYKTGFLGLLVFLAFWGLVLKKWWSGRKSVAKDDFLISVWTFTGIGLISGLIWMLTEDLDAPPIAAFLYFIVVGLALSIDKLKSSPDQIVTAAADPNQNQSMDQSIEQTAEKAPPLARDPNSSEPHS